MEIKKIEKSDFVMFPRMQHRGLEFRHVERNAFKAELRMWKGMVTTGWYISNRSRTLWPTSNCPRLRQSLTTSLAGAWGKTNGASTLRGINRSSASLQASMPQNSPPSTLTSSVSASMPSAMPLAGGMSTEKNVKLQIALLLIYPFQKLLFRNRAAILYVPFFIFGFLCLVEPIIL